MGWRVRSFSGYLSWATSLFESGLVLAWLVRLREPGELLLVGPEGGVVLRRTPRFQTPQGMPSYLDVSYCAPNLFPSSRARGELYHWWWNSGRCFSTGSSSASLPSSTSIMKAVAVIGLDCEAIQKSASAAIGLPAAMSA